MFEIILRNPEQTVDNPFKINFVNAGASTSITLFISWIWDNDDIGI